MNMTVKLEITFWYNFLDRDHFPFETKTETDFDIVLMAPHDTKQACRKRVKIKPFIDQ